MAQKKSSMFAFLRLEWMERFDTSSEFIFTRIILVMDNWLNNNWNIQLVTSSYLNFVLTVVSQLKCLFIQRNQLIATVTTDLLHNWCSIIKIKISQSIMQFSILTLDIFLRTMKKFQKFLLNWKSIILQLIRKCIL